MKQLFIVVFILFSLIGNATNYYFSTTGNDSNTGLSTSQAWQTISKVNSSMGTFAAGDSILFKRGDTWSGTGRGILLTKSGSAGNPIIMSAYGTGAKPIISYTQDVIHEWTLYEYWTFDNLDLRTSSVSYYTTYHSCITFYAWSGDDPANARGIEIKNCNFNASIFIAGYGIHIHDNTFNGISNDTSGGALIVRGQNGRKALIENNTIYNYKERGIWIFQGVDSVIVRNNTVYNIFYGIDHLGACVNIDGYGTNNIAAEVYSNTFYNSNWAAISLENPFEAKIYNNRIDSCEIGITGITYPDDYPTASNLQVHHNVINVVHTGVYFWGMQTATISNNTIVNSDGVLYSAGMKFDNNSSANPNTGITCVNNIIWGDFWTPFYTATEAAQWTTWDYNIFKLSGTTAVYFGSTRTLAQIQALGFMTHGLTSNPQFISTTNFQLQSTSPAINIGTTTANTIDYLNRSIVGGTQDIGAYEYTPIIIKKGISAGGGKAWGISGVAYGN